MRAIGANRLIRAGLASLILGIAANGVAAEPPSPERFLSQGKAADFLPIAKKFLDENPDHERAAQTAWDLCRMARIAAESKEARDARLRLVADYPESLPAQHLLASMSADDYASVLKACFRHLDVEKQSAGVQRFMRGFDVGEKQYGLGFGDKELVLQLALASGDDRWGEIIPRLKQPDAATVQIAMLAFDKKLSGKEKILRLQEFKDNETAKAYQRLLYARLPADDREQTDAAALVIHAIIVQDLLEEEEFPQAARLLARVCRKSSDPELLYGWAIAEAAQGHGKEAAEILKRLVKETSPGPYSLAINPFREPASTLIPVFEKLDANFAEQDKVIGEAVEALRRTVPELLEFKLDTSQAESGNLVGYLRLDLKNEAAELVTEHHGKVVCALETSLDSSRVFLLNYPQIRKYAQRAGFPSLTYDIEHHPDGTGKFSFGMVVSEKSQGQLRASLESLISSRQLLEAGSRQQWARFAMAEGHFPSGVKTENGKRVLTWISVSATEPKLGTMEIHLNADQQITTISSKGATLHVRYGAAGKPQLAFPAWPSIPVENLAELKGSDFFRILGEAAELVMGLTKESEAEVAAKKEKETR